MSNKSTKAIPGLLIVGIFVLIIINLNLSSRLSHLEQGVNQLSFGQNQLSQSLRHEIFFGLDTISEQLARESSLSFAESTAILGYNSSDASADIEVTFYLKEFHPEDTVYISARGINGQTFTAPASISAAGRFTAIITLPLQDNYSLSFTLFGASNRSGALTDLALANMLCERFRYNLLVAQFFNNAQPTGISLNPHFANYTQGHEDLRIRTILLIIEADGTEIARWDLRPFLRDEGGRQVVDDSDLGEYLQHSIDGNSGESFVARLIIYDNLGIRYEQMDQIIIFDRPNMSGNFGFYYSDWQNRVIEAGEASWQQIYLVRQ